MWITEDLKELWNEREILPNWMARTLVILFPVLVVYTLVLITSLILYMK